MFSGTHQPIGFDGHMRCYVDKAANKVRTVASAEPQDVKLVYIVRKRFLLYVFMYFFIFLTYVH